MTTTAEPLLSDAPLGEVIIADDTLQVVFHRRYAKPVEKVWAALTLPERLADWFAAVEMDLVAGGVIKVDWNNGHNTMEGRVLICDPPRVLAWTWPLGERETVVRFDLQPDQGGCLLTLTHSGLNPAPGKGGGVRQGWHAHLEGIPDALEGRATPWAVITARMDGVSPHYPALSG